MHHTRVYYWVSSWWANRIGLASLTISIVNIVKSNTVYDSILECITMPA